MSHLLIQTANALVNGKPSLESMLLAFKDKNIPLETRWEAYSILVNGNILVDNEGYGDGFINTLKSAKNPNSEYSLYDDFYMERHETKNFTDMFDQFNEWGDYESYRDKVVSPESLIAWKETVLASGLSSFTNDW